MYKLRTLPAKLDQGPTWLQQRVSVCGPGYIVASRTIRKDSKQRQNRVITYPQVADIRKGIRITRIMNIGNHIRQVRLLWIPQCLRLVP